MTDWAALAKEYPGIKHLLLNGGTPTRERYLKLTHPEGPPKHWDQYDEDELPPPFRRELSKTPGR